MNPDLPSAEKPSFLNAAVVANELRYPEDLSWFGSSQVEAFFTWASKQGTSDITITTNDRIVLEIHGKKYRVTNRPLGHTEVLDMLVGMYKNEGAKAILAGDQDLDFAYQIKPSRDEVFRYRVNATAVLVDGMRGVSITARTIPDAPYSLSDLGVEDEIYNNMSPLQGMVLVTGGTGSGKSTLLAAMIRSMLEEENGNRKILTYESPIEYVYDGVKKPSSLISQSEVPAHLPSFARAIRNALRRKPDAILVGEMRDAETIGEGVTASMTGHGLYSTVHSNGFIDTIRRMVNVFPEAEKNGRAVDIISSLRLIISQRLVPSTDGKRVALREYVVFNDEIVDFLLDKGLDHLTTSCRVVLHQHGRSFVQDARQKHKEGRISDRTLKAVEWGSRGEDLDAAAEIQRQEEKLRAAKAMGYAADSSSSPAPPLPGLMDQTEMSHVEDPAQEPRLNWEKP